MAHGWQANSLKHPRIHASGFYTDVIRKERKLIGVNLFYSEIKKRRPRLRAHGRQQPRQRARAPVRESGWLFKASHWGDSQKLRSARAAL